MRKQMNEKINGEFENMIKSDFSAIKKKMKNNEGVILEMENKKMSKKNIALFAGMPALAAGLLTVVLVTSGSAEVVSNVTIDVNPGISLSLNKKGEVEKVEAINKDAEAILKDVDVIGDDIKEATEEIVEEMVEQNYITTEKNSILISTSGDNASQIKIDLTNEVEKYLNEQNIEGSIISQTVDIDDDALEALAEKYNVSEGKMELISKILEVNNTYSVDKLVTLTINELNIILNNSKNTIENVETLGNASVFGYMSSEEALEVVLNDLGVSKETITNLDIELDYDNNQMVYEIEFDINNTEYDYELNAKTLEILKSEFSLDDDNDNDSDDNDDNDDDNDDESDYDDNNDDDDNDDDDNDDDDNDNDNDDNDDDNDDDDNDDDDNDEEEDE